MTKPKCEPFQGVVDVRVPFYVAGEPERNDEIDQKVSDYLAQYPPLLTAVFYEGGTGMITDSAELYRWHEDEWPRVLERLAGPGSACFISDWTLCGDILSRLPDRYPGQIIQFSDRSDKPAHYELVADAMRGNRSFAGLWSHTSWGFVLPEKKRTRTAHWLGLDHVSRADVTDFFATVDFVFWVEPDLWETDGIVVLSHKFGPTEMCARLSGL